MAHSSDLTDQEKLKSGDYVEDPIFGVVPKDVETLNKIREQDLEHELAEASSPRQAKQAVKNTPTATGGNTK